MFTHTLSINSLRLRHVMLAAVAAAIVAGVIGCAKSTPKSPLGPSMAWDRAQDLYQRERYYRAQEILRDIILNYPGAAMIDSAQFLLGRATFELEDPAGAAEEFKRVVSQYYYSKLAGDAVYWEARCYYEQSPPFSLDQELTRKALDGFQRFLEDFAHHALTDSAYRYLSLCRDKLAQKEYSAASLYFLLGEYSSSILYVDEVLSDYYDTSWSESALFLKGRCLSALKDWPRTRDALQLYLDTYPDGKHRLRARHLRDQADAKASAATSAQTSP